MLCARKSFCPCWASIWTSQSKPGPESSGHRNAPDSSTATVHNSAAYRALGLEFELWSHASLGVVTLYLQHFENLLSASKHARYNVLRTFQKAAMVRKMLYALRSGYFDLEVVPVVVGESA